MGIALGVGLTSACVFNCRHCYSGGGANPVEMDTERLFRFMENLDVGSVNLGTGESCLHPQYHQVLDRLFDSGIPVAVTTAGPSVEALSDCELARLHDVDFSLDFPNADHHDQWRSDGAFRMVLRGIQRCSSLGVTASVAMCLMGQNAMFMEEMCHLCTSLGVSLRVNVYKAVSSHAFQADYDSFWKAVDTFFRFSSRAVSSEPIVNAALARQIGVSPFRTMGSPCGIRSLRLRPDGGVLPCVYWNSSSLTMDEYLPGAGEISCGRLLDLPELCAHCPEVEICSGGCAGRRLYTGKNEPDIYCFRKEGRYFPDISVPAVLEGNSYVHSSYLCTMIAEFGS